MKIVPTGKIQEHLDDFCDLIMVTWLYKLSTNLEICNKLYVVMVSIQERVIMARIR